MTVLLTGATGFLGCRILRALLADGTDEPVHVLGRGTPPDLRTRVEAAVSWLDSPPIQPDALRRLRCFTADMAHPELGIEPGERARVTDGVTVIWHCAALLALQADPVILYRTNVLGTRGVLNLAESAPNAHVLHISTAYVAGRRQSGHVTEDDLSDEAGFHVPYEETKHTAERLVHAWCRRTGRAATILRPSLLITDRRVPDGLPEQPLGVLARLVEHTLRTSADEATRTRILHGEAHGAAMTFRVPGDPGGSLNFVQADYAVSAMTRVMARRARGAGVHTVHVTHPHNTPVALVKSAFEARYPGMTVQISPTIPAPTPLESAVIADTAHLAAYSTQRRTYDRTHLLRAVTGLPDPPPLGTAYLLRALTPAEAPAGL
ncbi:SDR family oxidoreductase [Streptomyces hesseae]|uniref:SDR family oxidoreductase n=1 Tax=Streptomyces hesseae TaxID=3075519 RepID=A0ABU2SJ18_9ACTN|nr:SDR family oxidoreductase [Streptomyces sp. DSM 40473]MDT0448070.1 SDR family oxidoreductase [Streptomyces sp. DSM 40473]